MSSYIVNPQLGQSSQVSKHMSTSMPTQSIITEKPSSMEYINPSPRNHNGSVCSGDISNNIQPELRQQPHQPQPPQKQQPLVPHAKKLVDKFAPRNMKNKSDRQLIVETAYCNWNGKKDGTQSDQRSNKMAENMKPLKKKKRAPINITEGMSRADIFAANVASAVDAAEDADEEEDYIYSNGHSRTPSLTSSSYGMPQLQSYPFPHPHMPSDNNYGYPFHMPSNIYGAIPSHRSYNNYLNRPPFYGYYNGNSSGSDTDDMNSNQSSGSQHNTYKPTGVMRSSLPDMSQYVAQYKKGYPNYGSTNYLYNGWYGDEERLPLFAKPPKFETPQSQSFCTASSSLTAFILFLMVFSYVIYFTSTLPLTDVSIIDISDVLAADKELMFNIHVMGRNFGLWNVEIVHSDLNVFATPVNNNNAPGWIPGGPGSHWDDVKNQTLNDVTPSEFLGSILLFDEPLVFAAGVNRKGVVSEPSGQVRLRNPGGEHDKEGQDRWSHILRGQYDLTVRGVLKYSLPFSKHHVVRVCYAIRVDGGSGSNGEAQVGDDDDTLLSSNTNVILGACGDWEEESEKMLTSDE